MTIASVARREGGRSQRAASTSVGAASQTSQTSHAAFGPPMGIRKAGKFALHQHYRPRPDGTTYRPEPATEGGSRPSIGAAVRATRAGAMSANTTAGGATAARGFGFDLPDVIDDVIDAVEDVIEGGGGGGGIRKPG